MKIFTKLKTRLSLLALTFIVTTPVLAAGLEDATDAADEIKTWAYTFLGVVVFIFLIYKVGMALMDKETWGDVIAALGKVAIAGGIVVAGEWAWAIFGA